MSIKDDHDAATAASMQVELERFNGDCRYDPDRKKIVYRSAEAALRAYMIIQAEQMEKHKWLESEKAHHDLRDTSLSDWVNKHSTAFREYWHRTHAFVSADKQAGPPDRAMAG